MKVLDLFSGIGGFSLGLERAGMETVAFCEINPYCQRVLAKHWPDVPIYDDIRGLNADTLRRDGIDVDLICGGFPCQDISVAGKGAGLAGERSGLWFEYRRIIGEIRPRWIIIENVPAILARGGSTVVNDLATLGYDCFWECIPASAVGALHRRDRWWCVAYASGARLPHDQRCSSGTKCNGNGATDCGGRSDGEHNQWSIEPDVGGRFDGFPVWLVRCVGKGMNLAESSRAVKTLRSVWSINVSQALWRAAGGLERIQAAQVLFSFVRELENGSHEARLLVAGKKTSEEFLRGLRIEAIPSGAPYRPSEQHTDTLQDLSRLLALNSQAKWVADSWDDAVPRVATGIPYRVDRLRGLGNAVVPQIPELIGRSIMQTDQHMK